METGVVTLTNTKQYPFNDSEATVALGQAQAGVKAHARLRQLGLFPSEGCRDGAYFFLRNYGERIAARGGSWFDLDGGGIWDLYLRETRAFIYPDIGFRAAFVEI